MSASRPIAGASHARTMLGFTLLELLVVVIIVTVLACLLFPALRGGQQAARRAQCVSQLRQLGLAAQMYWDEHDGRAFRYRGAATNGGDIFWFGWLQRGQEGRRDLDVTQGSLYPYLAGRGVELCPSLAYWSGQFKMKARVPAHGYGYNMSLSAPTNEPPVALSDIRRSERLAIFGDAAQVNTFLFPASPSNPMLEEFFYLSPTEPTVHFRHNERANIAFADGHVEALGPVEDSIDMRMPEARVGLIPSSYLNSR